jgi:hypothetical protein
MSMNEDIEMSSETGCCPRFDARRVDDREFVWKDRLFVQDRVRSAFHIPLNFGSVMRRNMKAIEAADASDPDFILLSEENSLWGTDIFLSVQKEVPGARATRLSGTFYMKAFEGPYSKMRVWMKEMTVLLKSRNQKAQKLYFWYTTCPKCAKVYGKNWVVLVAQVA